MKEQADTRNTNQLSAKLMEPNVGTNFNSIFIQFFIKFQKIGDGGRQTLRFCQSWGFCDNLTRGGGGGKKNKPKIAVHNF